MSTLRNWIAMCIQLNDGWQIRGQSRQGQVVMSDATSHCISRFITYLGALRDKTIINLKLSFLSSPFLIWLWILNFSREKVKLFYKEEKYNFILVDSFNKK